MAILLGRICECIGGELTGDSRYPIESAESIERASDHQITFAEHGPHLKQLNLSRAGAVIVPRGIVHPKAHVIQVDHPRLAFAKTLQMLYPPSHPAAGIHASCVLGDGVELGKEVCLSAGVVIGDRAKLGDRVVLYPHVVLGNDVSIGDDTTVYPNVSIMARSRIGGRVIIHSGSVIGSDGFGFVVEDGRQFKIPQIGFVQIDDDVEIGANNAIDRGSFGRTWIKEGVKTDNQVHIAHNVEIGAHSLIVAQVGIAGSTTIGHHAILAGQSGISGHLTLGDEVIIGPRTGVGKPVPDKHVMSGGIVAMPHSTWLRLQHVLPSLPDLFKQVRELSAAVKKLAQKVDG